MNQEFNPQRDQNHPLNQIDREHINSLLSKDSPKEEDLVDLARLLIRYEDFPGANDLKEDLLKILNAWGMNRDQLHKLTRDIWSKGFRPGRQVDDSLGSGFDTSDKEEN